MYLFYISAFLTFSYAVCAPPSFVTKCKSDDPKCIKESTKALIPTFANGLPEYGVDVMDPLKIKHINASEGNLLFKIKDITITGMKNCKVLRSERDKAKSKIYLVLQCSVILDGDYILKGSVLVVPIQGDGKVHVDMNSAIFDIETDVEEVVGDDGKTHWNIKSFKHNFDLKEKSNVVFENLFKDNAILRQAATELIANNGNDVIKEIGKPIIKYVMTKVLKNVNHFFKAIPATELSLN